eukprot:UN29212
MAAGQKKIPQWIEVQGRVGVNSLINGIYSLAPTKSEAKPYYHKLGRTHWVIRWNSKDKAWLVSSKGLIKDDTCCARSDEDVIHPGLIKVWYYVVAGGHMIKDKNICSVGYEQFPTPPSKVFVSGVCHSKFNGEYKCGTSFHENRPYYYKSDNSKNCDPLVTNKYWMVYKFWR